jgi:O-antigen/teichoic acid export membrane protein
MTRRPRADADVAAPSNAEAEPALAAPATSGSDLDRVQRHAAVVSATTLVVSIANYALSVLLIRLLAAPDYVAYASIQSLLLVLGSGGMAAIPWAVARHVALTRTARAAGEALGFGLVASCLQGLVFAGLSFALVAPSSGARLGFAAGAAAFALSVIAAPLGLLQGQGRLVAISVLRLIETVVRIGVSLVLVIAVAADPLSPITGFIVGSAILTVAALIVCRAAFPLRRAARATYLGLLRHSALLGVAQLALAALGTMDTVVIALTTMGPVDARDYQVAALLGRVPLFLGAAVALTYYPQIASAASVVVARLQLARAARLIVVIGVPVAVLLATCPVWALEIIAPGRADQVAHLLPFTAITGITVATATVLACARQAREGYRRLFVLLLPIVAVQPFLLVLAGDLGTATTFAACAAALGVVVLAALSIDLRSWRPWSQLRAFDIVGVAVVIVLAVLGREVAWVWWIAAIAAVALCLSALRRVSPGRLHPDSGESPRRARCRTSR